MIWNGEYYQSRVDRYELRAGVLTNTAQLTLDGRAEAISATPDRLLAATVGDEVGDPHATVTTVDITQPELSVAFTASFPGEVGPKTQLELNANQLRVLYIEPETRASRVATFQLGPSSSSVASGICSLGSTSIYDLDSSLFSAAAGELFVSNAHGEAQLEQLAFDASGACPVRTSVGSDSRSFALQTPEPDRLLALGSGVLRLYDTDRMAVLAQAPVSAQPAVSSQESLQLARLRQPIAAPDGTSEALLTSVLSSSPEHSGRYELLTMSGSTLTPRGRLDVRGSPERIALVGRSLVAVSSTQLSTFDSGDLNAPVALGQLELAERYPHVFGFDEHIARIRQHPVALPPGERNTAVRDDLQVLARRQHDLLATLPVESEGQWLQIGALLVNAQLSIAQYGSESERKARVAVQAYDLSDPTRPRKAGALSTTDIEAEWTPGHFYEPSVSYLVAGDALIIPQRKREPNVHVRQCWKTVEYDACSGESSPDCEDVYTGTLFCRSVDAEPEVCTVNDLTHCTAEGCENLEELPVGIPSIEDGCNNYEEPGRAGSFAFNVIDLQDPDKPSLIKPLLELPDNTFLRHSYFVSGTKIYATESQGDALFVSAIDLRDPSAPLLSARQAVSGRVVAATERDLYIGPRDYNHADFTLARVRCCGVDPQPLATRSWPGRNFESVVPDGAGHLLLLHSKIASSEPAPNPRADWTQLEILDQLTLSTLGTLDIDKHAAIMAAPSDSRLLLDSSGVLYLVDIRAPQLPRMQAAVPHHTGPVLFERGQLIISDELGFHSYPTTLENMLR
jgi:hypothetical protein